MRALAILAVPVALAVAAVAVTWLLTRARNAREDRRDLIRHKQFVRELHVHAIQAEGIDPTAHLIAEKIRAFHHPPSRKSVR